MKTINEIIRARRSVYPAQYINKPISKEIIHDLLTNANHAPTHRLTEPWRFKVFMDAGKKSLGDFLSEKYMETTPNYMESKAAKIKNNMSQAGAVIAIILHRDPEERVPEWEEIAAVSCAIQNLWISLQHYDLGGYWSSPGTAAYLSEHVSMEENEQCLGFFYLGYCEPSDRITPKKPIEEKVEWIE